MIGIKKFRQNMTSLWKDAKKKNIRYIVMHHAEPILEVKPIKEEDLWSEKLVKEIAEAREQVKRGEVYTQEEIMEKFGIKP
jgi:CRISPR/Cas system-associated endonuclease Cas3-HD